MAWFALLVGVAFARDLPPPSKLDGVSIVSVGVEGAYLDGGRIGVRVDGIEFWRGWGYAGRIGFDAAPMPVPDGLAVDFLLARDLGVRARVNGGTLTLIPYAGATMYHWIWPTASYTMFGPAGGARLDLWRCERDGRRQLAGRGVGVAAQVALLPQPQRARLTFDRQVTVSVTLGGLRAQLRG